MDGSLGVTGKDRDDSKLLKSLSSLAVTGCVLLVENFDRDAVARHFQWTLLERFPKHTVRASTALSKPGSKTYRATWSFYREAANKVFRHLLTTTFTYHAYSLAELERLVRRAGWKNHIACYGDLPELLEVKPEDWRTFLVCKK